MKLKTKYCGVEFKNPTVLASGVLGMNADILKEAVRHGAGGVTTKSTGIRPRDGHPNPKFIAWEAGIANCYGLTNQGYLSLDKEFEELRKNGPIKAPVITSIFGADTKEFTTIAEHVAKLKPDMIELNLSCPNTKKEGMLFGLNPKMASKVISKVKEVTGKVPIIPKLTPQANDIGGVAKACEDAGADGISAINTVGPGMFINVDIGKPVLSFKTGGLSGPAIKPIAVRCIYDIYKNVEIPIIGMGGVNTGRDAIELMMAGATLVGIGSGAYYRGIDVFDKVTTEMKEFLEKSEYKKLNDIIGVAHD